LAALAEASAANAGAEKPATTRRDREKKQVNTQRSDTNDDSHDGDDDSFLDERGESLDTQGIPSAKHLRRREQKPVIRAREHYRSVGRMRSREM
jgi:hypothetical protein